MSSDKIEKNNKKNTHWKLLCLFPNIISHLYICCLLCVRSKEKKRGGRERRAQLYPATHVYILSMFSVLFFFSIFQDGGRWKKKYHKNINRSKEYHEATQTTDSDGIEKLGCVEKSVGVLRRVDKAHSRKKKKSKMREKKWRGKRKCPDQFSVIFSCYKNFCLFFKSPGTRDVRHREERMINTTKQGRFYVAAFTTNRHVTRRRFAGVRQLQCWLSLGALSKCLALELCIIIFFRFLPSPGPAMRWRRRRRTNE